jgi:outer membrane protein assembly factor BamA
VIHLFLCSVLAAGGATGTLDPVRIGAIRIESNNVFSADEAAKGWFYRLANRIHIETHEGFLRKQLLFREGETLNIAKLAETERNLRALPFIKSASVVASAPRDGVSDVLVVTQDAWTTQPGGSFGSKGGKTTYSVEFQETDLLGWGKAVSIAYDHGSERTVRSILYQDPYLFAPFWGGKLIYADNSDGRQRALEVSRPFYSFQTPWSADLSLEHLTEREKLYQDGEEFSTFQHERRDRFYSYGRAIRATESGALRWTAGVEYLDEDFTSLNGDPAPIVPDRRRFRYIFGTYESVGNAFATLNYINRDSRYEDFNLAPRLFVKAAYSPAWLGAPRNSSFLETELSGGYSFGDDSFAQAEIDAQSRFESGPQNTIVSAFVGYARRFRDVSPLQTFVARAQYDQGRRLDQDVQFAADGLAGLRGYQLHSWTGDKRFLANLEQRFFSEREYLQLASPGAVVFFDTGAATPHGTSLWSLRQFHSDIGVGIRIAIARAGGNNILRIDFAYPFDKDPRGRHGLLVSFSSSQAFKFRRSSPSGD